MIDRGAIEFTPYCDCCGKILFPYQSVKEAVAGMAMSGWMGEHVDGVWIDKCDECQRGAYE